MNEILLNSITESIELKKKLLSNKYLKVIEILGNQMINCISNGGKIMLCGNGGSAADAQHLAAEFLVRLRPKVNRQALPAIALAQDTSTITACGNDLGFDRIFERNLLALGQKNDILICLSTSGRSKNIELAAKACNSCGVYCFGLLGSDGGSIKDFCNEYVVIPSQNTARIQEAHITLGHAVMEFVEEGLLKNKIIELT